jgi:alkylhydroperoxidase family enzyme
MLKLRMVKTPDRREFIGLAVAAATNAAGAATPAATTGGPIPPRVALQSPATMPELFQWLEPLRPGAGKSNLFRSLANCPDILKAFIPMADIVRKGEGIDPRLRELAIVMVCQTVGATYEHGRHWNMALQAGVSRDQLQALWDFESSTVFAATEKAVLRLARAASRAPDQVSSTVWEDVRRALGDRQGLALLFSIGWYNMTGRLTGALDLQDEPGFVRL